MKMNKQDAFDKFGSYLSVQVGNYDSIAECLGSYEQAREDHTIVLDDEGNRRKNDPLPWYFENNKAGLIAAKLWAFEHRSERRTSAKFHNSIAHRNKHRNSMFYKILHLRARLTGHKKFLQTIVDYDAETERLKAEELRDNAYNVKVVRMWSILELGNVLDIGANVFEVTNMQGGVTLTKHTVTGYSFYGTYSDSTVDVVIHSNFGEGSIKNEERKGMLSNVRLFSDEAEAKALAKKWATKIVADNSKWL